MYAVVDVGGQAPKQKRAVVSRSEMLAIQCSPHPLSDYQVGEEGSHITLSLSR